VLLQELTEQQAGPLVLLVPPVRQAGPLVPPVRQAGPLALPVLPERQAWLLLATWARVAPPHRRPLLAGASILLLSRKDEMPWV
jgi:hypothetical protein